MLDKFKIAHPLLRTACIRNYLCGLFKQVFKNIKRHIFTVEYLSCVLQLATCFKMFINFVVILPIRNTLVIRCEQSAFHCTSLVILLLMFSCCYSIIFCCKALACSYMYMIYWSLFNEKHTHIRLTALCLRIPRWSGTRKVKPIWIYWVKRERVAVASAGPYVSLQLAQTDNHTSIPPLFLLPSQHRQSTEGKLMRNWC